MGSGAGIDFSKAGVNYILANNASGSLVFTSGGTTSRLNINSIGDISFYDSTGVTQGLYWDASTQRLGLGTSVPTELLHIREDGADASILIRTQGATAGTYHAAKLQFELGASASGTRDWDIVADDPSNNGGYLGVEYEGSEKFRITAGGLVDIKKQINQATLPNTPSNHALTFYPPTTTGYYGGGISWSEGTNTAASINAVDAGSGGALHLAFSTGSNTAINEAMRLDASGNLLVGTTDALPAIGNVEGIALSAGSYGGRLEVSRDNSEPVSFNRKSSDGSLVSLKKDGITVGSIGTNSGRPYFASTSMGVKVAGGSIHSTNSSGSSVDATHDLGQSNLRWKDLYLSGGVYVGGTANPNYFDDYEEGTWTPSFNLVTVTHTVQYGRYIKIGKMVHCKARIEVSSIDNADASGIQMTVPISANSAVANGGTGCTFAYDSQNSTIMDGSHADVHGAYVSGTTFAVTNDTGGNMAYNQLTQTSGAFVFAFSYEAA